jgi:KUP system potassium uptake protein
MTRQAIQLGWLPRLTIRQTSAEGYGQIYVGIVNWLLMLVTIGLTLYFRKSDNLAAAYGIAVSMTMLMTTVLLFMAMREIWNWPLWRAAGVAGALMVVDVSFFAANSMKLFDGGYVPLLLASLVYLIMWVWHNGVAAMAAALDDKIVSVPELFAELDKLRIPRVPGTAVFLTRAASGVPSVLVWHVRQNRVLREKVIILQIAIEQVPWVGEEDRLIITNTGPQLWRATARFGFMERPDIPACVNACAPATGAVDLADVTYYIGHETLVEREGARKIMAWYRQMFAFMVRNSARASNYFRLPADQTVEIGRTVAI